jgi:hypothetical protein
MALIGLFGLLLVIYPFTFAVQRISGDEISDVSRRIGELNCLVKDSDEELQKRLSKERRELSFVFAAFTDECDPIYGNSSELPAAERIRRARELRTELEDLADEWFRLQYNLLGSSLSLDSRQAVLFVPIILWYLGVYVRTMSVKLRLIWRRGRDLLLGESSPSLADDLLFGTEAPGAYHRYPREMEQVAYLTVVGLSLLYLVLSTSRLWEIEAVDSSELYWWGLFGALVLAYYGVAYCAMVRRSLDVQFLGSVSNTWIDRALAWLGRRAQQVGRLIARLPRVSWAGGCAAVVMTLFLVMSRSCVSSHTGLEVLQGPGEAGWALANRDFIFGSADYEPMNSAIGVFAYAATVLIGALGLVLALIQAALVRRLSRFPGSRLLTALLGNLTLFLWLQVATYLFFGMLANWLLSKESAGHTITFYLVDSTMLLLLFGFAMMVWTRNLMRPDQSKAQEDWRRIRARYITALAPPGVMSALFLGDQGGIFWLLGGVTVMSVALQQDLREPG